MNFTIIVIDEPVQQVEMSLMDVLHNNPRLSIIRNLVSKSSLKNLLAEEHEVKKVCFERHQCLPLSDHLKEHFNNLKLFKQYTFQLPDNSVFKQMRSPSIRKLLLSPRKLNSFLKKHIFLGILHHNGRQRIIATPLKGQHHVTEIIPRGQLGKTITHDSKDVFQIDTSLPVKEGLVQILTPYNEQ